MGSEPRLAKAKHRDQLRLMTAFAQAVDLASELSVEEQEELVLILRRQAAERRRAELLQAVRETETEFSAGRLSPMSVAEIVAATQ